MDLGKPVPYPWSLAAATQLGHDRLAGDDLAAAQLVSVGAFLAPEPIPHVLFTGATAELPEPLAARAGDPLAWPQVLTRLAARSLRVLGDDHPDTLDSASNLANDLRAMGLNRLGIERQGTDRPAAQVMLWLSHRPSPR